VRAIKSRFDFRKGEADTIIAVTITADLDRFPIGRVIFGGTFDDPNWFKIERHIWSRSAQRWMVLPQDV